MPFRHPSVLLSAAGASLCAVLLVSMHAMPSPHGFVVAMQLDAMRAAPMVADGLARLGTVASSIQQTPELYWTGSNVEGSGYYADLVANPGERPAEYLEKQLLAQAARQAMTARQEGGKEKQTGGEDLLQKVQEENAAVRHAARLQWHPEMRTDIPTTQFLGSRERIPGAAQRWMARAFSVQQLGAKTLQPRSWVSITFAPKAAQSGATANMLPPPQKDPYLQDAEEKTQKPFHHITANPGRGTANWKYGADVGKDDFEDNDNDDFNYNFVTVSPKDARVGAYVRYVLGGPPGAVQSDAAMAAEAGAKAKAAADAALDAEPLLRPTKIFCSAAQHPDGAKPPPCEVVKAVPEVDMADDVYD